MGAENNGKAQITDPEREAKRKRHKERQRHKKSRMQDRSHKLERHGEEYVCTDYDELFGLSAQIIMESFETWSDETHGECLTRLRLDEDGTCVLVRNIKWQGEVMAANLTGWAFGDLVEIRNPDEG